MMSRSATPPTTSAPGVKPERLSVERARAQILSDVAPVKEVETLALRSALGRVLSRDIVSPIDVPGHTNAAVDGYALRAAELPANGDKSFRIVGTAWAGRPYRDAIAPGECVRVMTGAPMPTGTDVVVLLEQARADGELVSIGTDRDSARNVRAAGEDLKAGQLALAAGTRLTPAELGLIASLGIGEVSVHRRPRVAFFSTGDELRSLGEPLGDGKIYDSNRYTIFGMLSALGVDVVDLGVVRDERDAVEAACRRAMSTADALITSGGVSVGEADYVKQTIAALGTLSFWQVAMRPGRPFAYGRIGNAAFFGLPGNPVAVMVTFYQFVKPALRRLMGERAPSLPVTFRARSLSPLKTRLGRTEFIRGVVTQDANGELTVRSTGSQGSGILSSMSAANCFIVLPPECGDAEPGAMVDVQLFTGLM